MAQNVRPGRYDASFTQHVAPPLGAAETERTRVEKGDLLATIVGANTGNVCLFPYEANDYYVCQSVALMRLSLPDYGRFVEYYFFAEHSGKRQFDRYIYGAGRPHLDFEQLRQTVVTIPPLDEATEIVRLLDEKFSVLDALDHEVRAGLFKIAALRQSILKRAFSGQLVPQDPSDEPAGTLLARLGAEPDVAPARRKIRRKQPA